MKKMNNWFKTDTLNSATPGRRRRFTPAAIGTAAVAVAIVGLGFSGTYSGFIASIYNSTNTATTGLLTMSETTTSGTPVTCLSTDGGTASTNTATCATINKLGGQTLTPGQTVNVPISIKNTGTVPAGTFTLTPGACSQTPVGAVYGTATTLCSKINVVITSGATTVFSGTAAQLAVATAATTPALTMPAAPAAGVSVPFNFATTLQASADNTYQSLQASLPLTWTFNS